MSGNAAHVIPLPPAVRFRPARPPRGIDRPTGSLHCTFPKATPARKSPSRVAGARLRIRPGPRGDHTSTTQEVVIRLKRPLEQQVEFVWTSFEPLDRADSAAQQRDDHWIDERSGGGRTQAGRPRARRARVAHRELLVDRDVACADVTETRAVTSRVARRCRRVFACNPCGRHGAHRPLTRSFA
jgi:hypothetical protein